MKLAICVATMKPESTPGPGDIPLAVSNAVTNPEVYVHYNTVEHNDGIVKSYQRLAERATEDILVFMHDDVIVRERGWDERVIREFSNQDVGLVGFGGAKWHGLPDLYKVPYVLQNLRRGDYLSNVDDAETHGTRFTEETDVAVLDGYCIAIRRDGLIRVGGWAALDGGCDFFCYDYAICGLFRRYGYRIRCVGVRCHHRGGSTSVGPTVKQITSPEAYDRSHRWFYDNFKDVMPWAIKG